MADLQIMDYSSILELIKSKGDSRINEIVNEIENVSLLEKNAVNKIVDLHFKISNIEDEEIREKLMYLLNLKKKNLSWFDYLTVNVLTGNDEKAKKIINFIREQVDGKETDENLAELEKMIDSYDSNAEIKLKLNKKLKQLKKRTERVLPENFGTLIRYKRNEKGLSLQELSDLTGISTSYINRIEKGDRRSPSYVLIEKLCNILDLDIEQILPSYTNKNKNKVMSITEVLLFNDFTINGKLINKSKKELLIQIINYIANAEWKESKAKEMLELMQLIDEFKK